MLLDQVTVHIDSQVVELILLQIIQQSMSIEDLHRFNNTTAAGHPFALRQTSGGTAVTDGVSGDQQGVQYWTVPQSLAAGTTYVYQCTAHPAMVGNLTVV